MRLYKNGPAAPGSADRGSNYWTTKEYRAARDPQGCFPRCELHDKRLVDRFPSRCPLAEHNPSHRLRSMKDSAFAELGKPWAEGDHGAAASMLERERICGDCFILNMGNPTVRRLRRLEGLS